MVWYRPTIALNQLLSLLSLNQRIISLFGIHSPSSGCEQLIVRREWRSLHETEKSSYIEAVLCLQQRRRADPDNNIALSRFDEFQGLHAGLGAHGVGHFLPWHRYFVVAYEKALRDECGYEGAHPYWDQSIDADAEDQKPGSFFESPLFDPDTGFGGNGIRASEGSLPCVATGPFKNLTLQYGPGQIATVHCLTRSYNSTMLPYLKSSQVANASAQPTFDTFWPEVEGRSIIPYFKFHDSGHIVIGGEMSNALSAPGDPLFYLHHANIDRIWRMWQVAEPDRLMAISGRSTRTPPFENVTLDHPLDIGSLGPVIPIRDIMDIESSPWCYTYA